MALNATRVQQIAKAYTDLANLFMNFEVKRPLLMQQNSSLSIPWGDPEAMAAISPDLLDELGNIRGYNFTPAQLSNLIGSIDAITNDGGFLKTHLQNFLVVADPR